MEEKTSKPETPATPQPQPAVTTPPAPPPRKKKYTKQIYGGIILLVVAVLAIFYYLGFIAPYEDTDDAFIDGYVPLISSRVPGQVTRLLINDNQEVQAGDVLVEIDPRDYEASLALAQADLTAAQSQADSAKAQVEASESKVVQAQAAVTAESVWSATLGGRP